MRSSGGLCCGVPLLITGQLMCNEAITWLMFACMFAHTVKYKLWGVYVLKANTMLTTVSLFDCE